MHKRKLNSLIPLRMKVSIAIHTLLWVPSRTVVHLWSFYQHSSRLLRLNKATERMPCGWRANPGIKSQGSHVSGCTELPSTQVGMAFCLWFYKLSRSTFLGERNPADMINASFLSVRMAAKENKSGRPSTFTKSDRTIDQVLMCHREKTRWINSVSSTQAVVKSLI